MGWVYGFGADCTQHVDQEVAKNKANERAAPKGAQSNKAEKKRSAEEKPSSSNKKMKTRSSRFSELQPYLNEDPTHLVAHDLSVPTYLSTNKTSILMDIDTKAPFAPPNPSANVLQSICLKIGCTEQDNYKNRYKNSGPFKSEWCPKNLKTPVAGVVETAWDEEVKSNVFENIHSINWNDHHEYKDQFLAEFSPTKGKDQYDGISEWYIFIGKNFDTACEEFEAKIKALDTKKRAELKSLLSKPSVME